MKGGLLLEGWAGSRGQQYRWMALGVVWFAYFQAYFHRVALGPLIPQLITDLGISNALAGGLVSAYFIPYVLLQLPSGGLADRFGPRKIIPLSLLLLSLSIIWFSAIQSYTEGFLVRLVVGVGASFIYIPALKAVVSWFGVEERGRAIGLYTTGGIAGSIVALSFTPILALDFGWREGYALTSLFCFAAAGLSLLLLMRKMGPRTFSPAVRKGGSKAPRRVLGFARVLVARRLILAGFVLFVTFGVSVGVATWAYSYAVADLSVPPVLAGLLPSAYMAASALGQVAVPFASDRVGKRRPFLIASMVSAAACTSLLTVVRDVASVYLLVGLAGACVGAAGVMLFAIISEEVPGERVGVATGFSNMVGNAGPIFTPYAAGLLLDVTASYPVVFGFLAVLLLAGVGLSLLEGAVKGV